MMLKNLKVILKSRGMTQKSLSEQTGISLASVAIYVSGKGNPSLKQILKICDALNCRLTALIGEYRPVQYPNSEVADGPQPDIFEIDYDLESFLDSELRSRISLSDLTILEAYHNLEGRNKIEVDAILFQTLASLKTSTPYLTFLKLLNKKKSLIQELWASNQTFGLDFPSEIHDLNMENEEYVNKFEAALNKQKKLEEELDKIAIQISNIRLNDMGTMKTDFDRNDHD